MLSSANTEAPLPPAARLCVTLVCTGHVCLYNISLSMVRVCALVNARACVRVCVRARATLCMCARVCVCVCGCVSRSHPPRRAAGMQ